MPPKYIFLSSVICNSGSWAATVVFSSWLLGQAQASVWYCLTHPHKNRDYRYETVNGQPPKIKAHVELVSQPGLLLLEHIHVAVPF